MKSFLLLFALLLLHRGGRAQLMNPDFEQWDNPVGALNNRPSGWIWTNTATESPFAFFYFPPETNAEHNNYALKLSVWYNYTKDGAIQRVPINSRPTALSGFYKYEQNQIYGANGLVPDTARVSVFLTRWNAGTAQRDTLGQGILDLDSSAVYTAFSVQVQYSSALMPDSITVILDPSMVRRFSNRYYDYPAGMGVTSYFTVDHLSLENLSTDVPDINAAKRYRVYPIPCNDRLWISDFSGSLQVMDVCGRSLMNRTLAPNEALSVEELPAGTYFLMLNDATRVQSTLFVKK